ncbi:cysteine hydrolase family protein [Leptolyngbya cf. ectocarpi LEGE 11479]|uniref:Cysteine hydrolase family protein n=1 Tax=Leptolyngbya cf. ectocarpi LEGE 11479 TaxID=1828722 RepID=A0A929FC00_LEPEC|nr:cysteine hydrolase family protein [Leptolyngbya ectocarpi]MBE9069098.1 cysteine hydrolase family protein [Leptolyngbya cf. ectocarpi LEGE 11479]
MYPKTTALLLIGFQNDYFAPDGVLHRVIEASAKTVRTVDNTAALVRRLVDTPVLLISTPICFTPNYEELVEPIGILKTIKDVGAFQAGEKGFECIQELLPFQDRILEIPGKRGFNAFVNTNLDQVLHQQNITHLVLAGAVTSICIDSTGRSAHEKGYHVSVLSDCTSARTVFEQEFYLENVFPLYGETITSSEFVEKLAASSLC